MFQVDPRFRLHFREETRANGKGEVCRWLVFAFAQTSREKHSDLGSSGAENGGQLETFMNSYK